MPATRPAVAAAGRSSCFRNTVPTPFERSSGPRRRAAGTGFANPRTWFCIGSSGRRCAWRPPIQSLLRTGSGDYRMQLVMELTQRAPVPCPLGPSAVPSATTPWARLSASGDGSVDGAERRDGVRVMGVRDELGLRGPGADLPPGAEDQAAGRSRQARVSFSSCSRRSRIASQVAGQPMRSAAANRVDTTASWRSAHDSAASPRS